MVVFAFADRSGCVPGLACSTLLTSTVETFQIAARFRLSELCTELDSLAKERGSQLLAWLRIRLAKFSVEANEWPRFGRNFGWLVWSQGCARGSRVLKIV